MKVILGAVALLASVMGLDVIDSDRQVVVVAGWVWFLVLVAAGLLLVGTSVVQRPGGGITDIDEDGTPHAAPSRCVPG